MYRCIILVKYGHVMYAHVHVYIDIYICILYMYVYIGRPKDTNLECNI